MTLASKVIEEVDRRPGISDQGLSEAIFGTRHRRTQINGECLYLENLGRLVRKKIGGRSIGNFPADKVPKLKLVQAATQGAAAESAARRLEEAKSTSNINNFQRRGAISNTHAGRDFEEAARLFFAETGISLIPSFKVPVGGRIKKPHNFDLGSEDPPILVECKSYTWTETGNPPSAKLRGMNEVMLLFSAAPPHYRKILFVLKHLHFRTNVSLATHYLRSQGHLIGEGVEIWEFDLDCKSGARVF